MIDRLVFNQLLTNQKKPHEIATDLINLILHGMLESSMAAHNNKTVFRFG